jgi:hypothetical protein
MKPYSNVELAGPLPELPDRGRRCPCGAIVPEFEAIDLRAVMHMQGILEPDRVRARIVELTGCPPAWAAIWVLHARTGCPRSKEKGRCPLCGGELRTYEARQCSHCGADWHEVKK